MQDDSTLGTKQAMRELELAQQTLSKVENKLRGLQKDKSEVYKRQMKAPMPDLSKYISMLAQQEHLSAQIPVREKVIPKRPNHAHMEAVKHKYYLQKPMYQFQENHQHFSNKKQEEKDMHFQMIQKKNQKLAKLEQYYHYQNLQLDTRIKQINGQMQKVIGDKILLNRDNQELQAAITLHREVLMQEDDQNDSKAEIQGLKRAIELIEMQNVKIGERKDDLQRNLQQIIASEKQQMQQQCKMRVAKSNSHCSHRHRNPQKIIHRCPYHR